MASFVVYRRRRLRGWFKKVPYRKGDVVEVAGRSLHPGGGGRYAKTWIIEIPAMTYQEVQRYGMPLLDSDGGVLAHRTYRFRIRRLPRLFRRDLRRKAKTVIHSRLIALRALEKAVKYGSYTKR